MVRSPGFEPGSSAWEADVLARLDYDRLESDEDEITCLNFNPFSRTDSSLMAYICFFLVKIGLRFLGQVQAARQVNRGY